MLMKVTFLTLKYEDALNYFYNRKNVAYKSMIGMIYMALLSFVVCVVWI